MRHLDEEKLNKIDSQIDECQRPVSYSVKEFTLEYYSRKYLEGEETEENEIYVPEYQREFIWDAKRQSRFIESIILGLPIPFIFTAEIPETGRLEIVDGSQRVRTISAFLNDELKLQELKKLTELNGCYFSQLPTSRKRKIKNSTIRMVVLSSFATEEVRNELFDRINTSSVALLAMETRRGIYRGEFMDFITELANREDFKSLCPIARFFKDRREEEELVLRFFAFYDAYPHYGSVESKGVARYIDNYLEEMNKQITNELKAEYTERFNKMVAFVSAVYANQGFAKREGAIGVSKPYFEAIAVGIALAQKEKPNLECVKKSTLIIDRKNRNDFFNLLDGRYHTHTANKLKSRIDYVKEQYLS